MDAGEQRVGDEFDAEERWIAAYKRLLRAEDPIGRWSDDSLWEEAESAWRRHAGLLAPVVTPDRAHAIDRKGTRS